MSFMMFPPEVNSALMYDGAGSGPLMAAASAWNELAADLETTASSYETVIAQLTGGPWLGPTATRMASAAAPFIAWLQGSSLQAAQTSGQASLAAAAYESAFAATVPPAVIAANRSLLAALIATNFLGQNTPAIAATEAHYMEMWFQDGLTMDTYGLASQQATALPQQTPAPTTSDGGASADAAAAAQSTANSATSSSGLVSSGATSVAGDILPVQGAYYGTMMASMPVRMLISMANSMNASQAMQASNQALLGTVSELVNSKLQGLMGGISGQLRGFGSAINAQLASAHRLGGLSIPNSWAANAPEMASRAAPVLPATSVSPPTASSLPNSPFTQALMGSLSGRGVGTQAAKTASVKVETRTPAGG
jgi:PPE-repeat protein